MAAPWEAARLRRSRRVIAVDEPSEAVKVLVNGDPVNPCHVPGELRRPSLPNWRGQQHTDCANATRGFLFAGEAGQRIEFGSESLSPTFRDSWAMGV